MQNLHLNNNWRFFEKNKKVYLLNLVTSKQLTIRAPTKIEKEAALFILQRLEKGIKKTKLKNDILNQFPELKNKWFSDSIKNLTKYGVISLPRSRPKSLSLKYLLGLDRQLSCLEELFPGEGKFFKQKQLKEANVAILGLGTIAQYVILPLISSGVGNFTCVDFDFVEPRNIGRQPLFRKDDIGKSKAEVVEHFIKESRSGIRVRSKRQMIKNHHDVKDLIQNSDIVIHCCDYPRFEIHRWINRACLELRKPNLLVYSGRVGPFSIPYKTSCYGCLETFLRQFIIPYNELTEEIRKEGFGRYPELAVVGSLTGVLAAKEIIGFIIGITPETYNAFFDINPATLKVTKNHLLRQKNCYACQKK